MDKSLSDSIDEPGEPAEIFEERVFIPYRDGTLEGELLYDPMGKACDAAVILSPHPNFAGTMDNNVVYALSRQFGHRGFSVLRFNYPGIGRSTIDLCEFDSSFDLWDDVERHQRFEKAAGPSREAVTFLKSAMGDFIEGIHLVGYSFGGVIAMLIAAEDPVIRSATAISMPWISRYEYDFLGYVRSPKFFVSGDRDFAFEQKVFDRVWPQVPEPKQFYQVENDHFFRQTEESLAKLIVKMVESANASS